MFYMMMIYCVDRPLGAVYLPVVVAVNANACNSINYLSNQVALDPFDYFEKAPTFCTEFFK